MPPGDGARRLLPEGRTASDGDRERHAGLVRRRRTLHDAADGRGARARACSTRAPTSSTSAASRRGRARGPCRPAEERARVLPVITALRRGDGRADLGRHDQGRGRGRRACSRRRHGQRRERGTARPGHAAARRGARARRSCSCTCRGRRRPCRTHRTTATSCGEVCAFLAARAEAARAAGDRRRPHLARSGHRLRQDGRRTTWRCSPGWSSSWRSATRVVIGASRKGLPRRAHAGPDGRPAPVEARLEASLAAARAGGGGGARRRARARRRRDAARARGRRRGPPGGADERLTMLGLFHDFRWQDVVDISIVAFVVYQLGLLIRGTRAAQMLIGLVVLVAGVPRLAVLRALHRQLDPRLDQQRAADHLVVIFQDDIRRALTQVGTGPLFAAAARRRTARSSRRSRAPPCKLAQPAHRRARSCSRATSA